MALRLVSDQSTPLEGGRRATIILASDSIEELTSSRARQMAVEEAAKLGVSGGGVSKTGGTYPVDAEGNSNNEVMTGQTPVHEYRLDFDIRTLR